MLHTIASAHLDLERYDEAEKVLMESLMVYQAHGQSREAGLVLCTQSRAALGQGRCEEAMKTALQALEVFQKVGEVRGEALAQLAVCNVHHSMSQCTEAINAAMEARSIFSEQRLPQQEAESLHLLTQVYMSGGWPGKAVMSAKSALALLQEDGGCEQMECLISGLVTDALLLIACEEGPIRAGEELSPAWQKASQAANDELALARRLALEDVQHLAKALLNVGRASYMTCQFEVCGDAVQEALQYTQEADLEKARSQVLLLQAQLLCTLGQRGEASDSALAAREIFQKHDDTEGLQMVGKILSGDYEHPVSDSEQKEQEVKRKPVRKAVPRRQVVRREYKEEPVYQRDRSQDYEEPAAPVTEVKVETQVAKKGPSLEDLNGKVVDLAASMTGNDEVFGDTPLMDAGLDSLGSVEFQNQLSKEFKGVVHFPSTLMFDYPTSKEISSFIYDSMMAKK